jgi:hypothetical protein
MNNLIYLFAMAVFYLLPVACLAFLIAAFRRENINLSLIALWISLITVMLQYQLAGDEIIGTYFDYFNAAIYTINILLLIISALYLFYLIGMTTKSKLKINMMRLVSLLLVLGCGVLLTNLWMNAVFISSRYPKTPIMQVVMLKKPAYCNHHYVLIKINKNAVTEYLCPNGRWLIPTTGIAKPAPKYIAPNLSPVLRDELAKENPEWKSPKKP